MWKKIVVAFLTLLLFFNTSATGFASSDGPVFIEQEVNENEPNVFFESAYPEFGDSFGDIGTLGAVGQCDYNMSGYQFHSKIKYNGQITKVLVSTGALIVSTRLPWLSANQKTGVQVLNIFNMGLGKTVYYTQDYSRMYALTGKSPLPVAAEKTVTRYYSDSSYTKLMDTKIHYNYSRWYCK